MWQIYRINVYLTFFRTIVLNTLRVICDQKQINANIYKVNNVLVLYL